MLQTYCGDDLLHLCVIHKSQNADNAWKFEIWFDDKLREVYVTNEFITVRR